MSGKIDYLEDLKDKYDDKAVAWARSDDPNLGDFSECVCIRGGSPGARWPRGDRAEGTSGRAGDP